MSRLLLIVHRLTPRDTCLHSFTLWFEDLTPMFLASLSAEYQAVFIACVTDQMIEAIIAGSRKRAAVKNRADSITALNRILKAGGQYVASGHSHYLSVCVSRN